MEYIGLIAISCVVLSFMIGGTSSDRSDRG